MVRRHVPRGAAGVLATIGLVCSGCGSSNLSNAFNFDWLGYWAQYGDGGPASSQDVLTVVDGAGKAVSPSLALLGRDAKGAVGLFCNATTLTLESQTPVANGSSQVVDHVSAAVSVTDGRATVVLPADSPQPGATITFGFQKSGVNRIWTWTQATPNFAGTGTIPAGTVVTLKVRSSTAQVPLG